MKEIEIGGLRVGQNDPPVMVAEIGMNHNGDVELGERMIRKAASAGADAVKFQTFRTNRFLSKDVDNRDVYRERELSFEDHVSLQREAEAQGVEFFSTPFDEESVALLEKIDVPCYKIASSDLTNYPLIRRVAKNKKPIILSTGYADFSEIAGAVEEIKEIGADDIILLHCVSKYPTPTEEMNLGMVEKLDQAFGFKVGLSDHSKSDTAAAVATAYGASLIEKHFTLDPDLPGFDHEMSETPSSFANVVETVEKASSATRDSEKILTTEEKEKRNQVRRSLYWTDSFKTGTTVDRSMLTPKRPGTGISPNRLSEICGNHLKEDVEPDTKAQYSQIKWKNE